MRPSGHWLAVAGKAWVLAVGLLVVGVGCGKSTDSHDAPSQAGGSGGAGGVAPSGGPRLVPWQIEADGTEPLVLGVFDTQLQQHCRFLHDSNGQLRCLPEAESEPIITGYFADAECQQAIYDVQPEVLSYAEQHLIAFPLSIQNDCDERRYVVGNARKLTQPTEVYASPDCGRMAGLQTSGDTLVTVAPVDPNMFVAAELIDGPSLSDRLSLSRIQAKPSDSEPSDAEPSAQFDAAISDERWHAPCELSFDTDPPSCIPPYAVTTGFSSQESCSGPVWRVRACETPTFIRDDFNAPDVSYAYGEPYTGTVYQATGHGRCALRSPEVDPTETFYVKGPPVTGEVLAPVKWQLIGDGPLQVRGPVDDRGVVTVVASSLAPRHRFYDATVHADCDPIWNLSGEARCVPHIAIADSRDREGALFSDDQCQVPAWPCSKPAYCEPSALAVVFSEHQETRASAIAQIIPAASLYNNVHGTCMPDATVETPAVTLGETVPWDTFPKFAEQNPRTPPGP